MKKLIAFIVFISKFSFAQGEAAIPFVTLQQSNLLLGAGQIGVSIPNNDVLGFYLNPAILGFTSKENHASIYTLTKKTDWFWSPVTFHNYGINLGYNLESKINFPLSIGLGFIHNKFDFGEFIVTGEESPEPIGKFRSYDSFNSFSLGIGFDYFAIINAGISIKSFDSNLGARYIDGQIKKISVDGTLLDYGTLIILPFSELFKSNLDFQLDDFSTLTPNLNLSLGYSLTNVGDEIYYVDESQKDALPRTARFGYTINFGYQLSYKNTKINFVDYSFTAEANDILVSGSSYDDSNQVAYYPKYQNLLGDINIIEHVISLNPDEKVIVHKGHIFNFFDTILITKGSFLGRGYSEVRKTDGIGVSSKGIFKLLNSIIGNSTISFITKHFQIDYYDSFVEISKGSKTNFNGISLHFIDFEL